MKYRSIFAGVLFIALMGFAGSAHAEEAKKPFEYKFKVGAQAFMKAELDGESIAGGDDIQFGVQRISLIAMGKIYDFAILKVHLLSMPATDLALKLADAHLTFKIHDLFNVKIGRFKKPLTRVYTPFWATWRFFDVPQAFKYVKGNLGLGGRGEGAVVFGGVGKRLIKYSLGVFNGLEEHVAKPGKFERTDEGVEVVARVDWQPVELFKMGLGVAYQNDTTFSDLTGATPVNTKMDMLAYAADLNLFWKGLTISGEFIGHMTMPDKGDGVLGGGFYADALCTPFRSPRARSSLASATRVTGPTSTPTLPTRKQSPARCSGTWDVQGFGLVSSCPG